MEDTMLLPPNNTPKEPLVLSDGDLNAVAESIEKAANHDALRLVRRLRGHLGFDEHIIRINVYPDSETARERTTSGSLQSCIRQQALWWQVSAAGFVEIPPTMNLCNAEGLAISWVPTVLDPKTSEVAHVCCVWTELDGGRRWSPEYAGPEPDIVVGSKNGDHLYWAVKGKEAAKNILGLLRALAIGFRGDPEVTRADHPMRLPGFDHRKDYDDPFPVKITHQSDRKKPWTARELTNALQ